MENQFFGPANRWFAQAFRAVLSQPLGIMLLIFFTVGSSSLITMIPVIGRVSASVWNMFCAVLLFYGTRQALHGEQVSFASLTAVLKHRKLRLDVFTMGAMCAFLQAMLSLVIGWTLGPTLAEGLEMMQGGAAPEGGLTTPWLGIIISLAATVPYLMATTFAPALVADGGLTPGKSIFFSFFGSLRHWKPLLAVLFMLTAIEFMVAMSIALALAGGFSPMLVAVLAPLPAIISTLLLGTLLYPMYRDLFGMKHTHPELD